MKPFYDLNRTGRFRRLTALARHALASYDRNVISLRPLQLLQNATWRAQCRRTAERYLLRIHAPGRHDMTSVQSELSWLEALGKAPGLIVPTPICTRDGRLWTTASAEGVPEPRICTMLTWVEGRCERKRRTPHLLRRMGRLMALLHSHAAGFNRPDWFVRPRWDYGGLFHRGPWTLPGWDRLTRRQERLFQAVADHMRGVTRSLGTGRDVFGLIHGDLNFSNVVFRGRETCPIDFDDCGFGYFMYDIAVLLDRIEMRDDYRTLRAALLEGYGEVRSLPAEQEAFLDLFLLTRWVFLGLCFRSRPEFSEYAPRFMQIVEPKMERYLSTAKSG